MTATSNAGKRWSSRDKADLAAELARGAGLAAAAAYLKRPIGEVAAQAAALGLLAAAGGKYTIELFDDRGANEVLVREDRLPVAIGLYDLMCAQYPDRLVMLRDRARVIYRSDRPSAS
jgi:hypothetical protein